MYAESHGKHICNRLIFLGLQPSPSQESKGTGRRRITWGKAHMLHWLLAGYTAILPSSRLADNCLPTEHLYLFNAICINVLYICTILEASVGCLRNFKFNGWIQIFHTHNCKLSVNINKRKIRKVLNFNALYPCIYSHICY